MLLARIATRAYHSSTRTLAVLCISPSQGSRAARAR